MSIIVFVDNLKAKLIGQSLIQVGADDADKEHTTTSASSVSHFYIISYNA